MKFINRCPKTPQIQGFIEQVNIGIKNKIASQQVVNGNKNLTDYLTEICDAINNYIHKFLFTNKIPMSLMFFNELEFQNAIIICIIEEKKNLYLSYQLRMFINFVSKVKQGKAITNLS